MASKKTPIGRPVGAKNTTTREERYKQQTEVEKAKVKLLQAELSLEKIKTKEANERIKILQNKK